MSRQHYTALERKSDIIFHPGHVLQNSLATLSFVIHRLYYSFLKDLSNG